MDSLRHPAVYIGGATAGAAVAGALMYLWPSGDSRSPNPYMKRIGTALAKKFGKAKPHGMHKHVIELEEKGAKGKTLNRRLFMQMIVLDARTGAECVKGVSILLKLLEEVEIPFVLYDDVQNPQAVGLLVWNEDPSYFVGKVRPVLQDARINLTVRPGWTTFGKTYANGHEEDMEYWLLKKPVHKAMDVNSTFVLWYPMRRKGEFYMLEAMEKCRMLMHHASIGRAYGESNLAHDIRLNCFGMDGDDNEFVIGVVGPQLMPLSKLIQDMRVTEHTSRYMQKLGPFFVGQKRAQFNPEA